MRSDGDIKRDVEAELRWSPDVDETDITIKVNDGEVTLTGFAQSYLEKYRAEIAVRRMRITTVANDITVKPLAGVPTDPEIARAAGAPLSVPGLRSIGCTGISSSRSMAVILQPADCMRPSSSP